MSALTDRIAAVIKDATGVKWYFFSGATPEHVAERIAAELQSEKLLSAIRELHRPSPWQNCINACCSGEECRNRSRWCEATDCDNYDWPCATARLAYSVDELAAWSPVPDSGLEGILSALSDRIAEVLRTHELKTEVWSWFECECGADFDSYQEWQAHVAAAVEAELQLTEETRHIYVNGNPAFQTRSVSAWSEVQP